LADFRNVSDRIWWSIALLAVALPEPCHAENYANYFHFGPSELFVIGAFVALPSAILCVLAEAIFPRRRLPLWLTGASAVAAVASIALLVVAMKAAAQQQTDSRVFLLFVAPPLVILALRGTIVASGPRLAAGWVIAAASLGLVAGRLPGGEAAWGLAGGAFVCLLLWTSTWLILRVRGRFPVELANAAGRVSPSAALSVTFERLAAAGAALSRALPPGMRPWLERQLARLKPAQSGLIWWFASACVLYFGIGAAISSGKLGVAWLYVEWAYLPDLFGFSYPKDFRPAHVWWTYGLPWSLLAGSAFWGLAGLFGGFDPGRAKILRFAAVVFGGVLLFWTVSIITRMAEVSAAEERASGIHR